MSIETRYSDGYDFGSLDEGALNWINWSHDQSSNNTPVQSSHSMNNKKHKVIDKSTHKQHLSLSNENIKLMLPEKTLCFCDRPAHRKYTLEYGPVLECARYGSDPGSDKIRYPHLVCGFHIHEAAWNQFKKMARKGENLCVDHPELKACPSFNLTFCSMFDVTNDYPKIPPTYPLCFCKKPVRIIDTSEEDLRIYFGCQNTVMDRPKCSWLMLGRDIAFPRQKHTIHQYVDEDTYFKNKQDKLDMIKKNRHLEQIQEAVMKGEEKLKGTTEDKAKHKMNTASNRVETTVNMLDKAENKKEMSTAGRETLDTHKLDLLFTLLKPPSTTTPQYYDMSSLTSLSNQYPSTYKHAEDTTEISALKSEIEKISNQLKEKDIQLKKMTDLKRSLDRLSNENSKLQTEIYYIQSEKDDEMISRISCQERLSSIDLDIVELMTENEKLMAEIDTLKGVPTVNENLKCKVCFNRPIEYGLLPCYHIAYCHLCVSRLTECAICRQQSTGIQKIYLC